MRPRGFILLAILHFAMGDLSFAQNITVELANQERFEPKRLLIPYVFYNESFGGAAGLTFSSQGYLQKQSALVLTGAIGSNDSRSTYLAARDIRVPIINRLFLLPEISVGRFGAIDAYVDGNPDFTDEQAGSNDSDQDNFLETSGNDNFFRLTFKFLLPIGHGRDTIINTYVLDRGLIHSGETGGDFWNPIQTGRTYLQAKPFYRIQDLRSDFDDEEFETNGVEFTIRYENTDYLDNPSRGSEQRLSVTRDWGAFSSTAPWTVIDIELTKYFSLGESPKFRQRVVAMDFWTANALTWDSSHFEDGEEIFHRPPNYAGATLGGLDRLRGYAQNRFSDQAAIYYAAELRLIPEWNPMGETSWLEFLEIKWWQFVPFVEVGRVADKWTIRELHSDMKWVLGFGLRAMVKLLVVRLDIAASEEGAEVQMFIQQPFPDR